jgi:hypothetical protein
MRFRYDAVRDFDAKLAVYLFEKGDQILGINVALR